MIIEKTEIPGLLIIHPEVHEDSRGYFFESHNSKKLKKAGLEVDFVQDNEAKSGKNVLRGLHFQAPPHAQGKLVRVIKGRVLDVAVDIRKGSPSYGKHCAIELSQMNRKMLWVPPGFAHGYITREEETIFFYKCTQFYQRDAEGSLRWDDPLLAIDWGLKQPVLSEKDRNAPDFSTFKTPFSFG